MLKYVLKGCAIIKSLISVVMNLISGVEMTLFRMTLVAFRLEVAVEVDSEQYS